MIQIKDRMSWTYCLISLFIGINLPIVNFTLATVCDSSFYHGYCKERTVSVSGDFNIAVPISIHHPMEDKFCGEVSISGVQTALAVEWIVSILNGNQSGSDSFIPGVKLGMFMVKFSFLTSLNTVMVFKELYLPLNGNKSILPFPCNNILTTFHRLPGNIFLK